MKYTINDSQGNVVQLSQKAHRFHIAPDAHSDHILLTIYADPQSQKLKNVPYHPTIEWKFPPELVSKLSESLDEIVKLHLR